MIDNGIDCLHLSENICQSIPIYPIILPSVIISLTRFGNDYILAYFTNVVFNIYEKKNNNIDSFIFSFQTILQIPILLK